MEHPRHDPHPTKPDKQGPSVYPDRPQPTAAEVESARLLANDAKDSLKAEGYDDDAIRRLADEYIALDLGEGVPEFVDWVRQQRES